MGTSALRTKNGKLDQQYLRTCTVYRLLAGGRIASKGRAIELLNDRGVRRARQTVELWLSFPLKGMQVGA